MYLCLKNSVFILGILTPFNFYFSSCDRLYSNYLQEDIPLPPATALSSEYEIDLFADSVISILAECDEARSMIYSRGNQSFQVKRYSLQGLPVLYAENSEGGELGKVQRRYFVKDGALVMIDEFSALVNGDTEGMALKSYFRNGQLFRATQTAGIDSDIRPAQFKEAENRFEDYANKLLVFEDAINQRGRFDLVFQGIAANPKTKYLILSKDEINAYRAPVRVDADDEFIRELLSNPSRYRGEKLDIQWRLNELNEAVYAKGRLKGRD